MGWQSYVFISKNEKHTHNILKLIRKHNSETEEDKVGESLYGIVEFKLLKNLPKCLKAYNAKSVIMCGHGGGRGYTFDYIEEHRDYYDGDPIVLFPYEIKWAHYISRNKTPNPIIDYMNKMKEADYYEDGLTDEEWLAKALEEIDLRDGDEH